MNNNIQKTLFVFISLLLFTLLLSGCAGLNAFKMDGKNPESANTLKNLKQKADKSGSYQDYVKYGYAKWFLENDSKAAREYWLKARKLDTKPVEALVGLLNIERTLGNSELSQKYMLEVAQIDPSGPYTELVLGMLYTDSIENNRFFVDIAPKLEKMQDSKEFSFQSRTYLVKILLKYTEYQDDLEKHNSYVDTLGNINKYSLLGPFGQFSALDYQNIYQPEKDWAVKKEYVSDGKTIERYTVDSEVAIVNPHDLFDNDGVVYNISYIKIEKEKDVVFTVSGNANCSLYVDNVKVVDINAIDEFPMGEHNGAIRLSIGWHKVLLKLGDPNGIKQATIFARDKNGIKAFSEMKSNMDDITDFKAEKAPLAVDLPENSMSYWYKATQHNPDFYNMFFLMQSYGLYREFIKFKQVVAQMMEINQNFSFLYMLSGFVLLEDPTLPKELVADHVRQMMLKSLELDENNIPARVFMASYYSNSEQTENAIQELNILKEKAPQHYSVDYMFFTFYQQKGWLKEQYDAIERALTKNRNDRQLLSDAYSFYYSRLEYDKAFKIADDMQKLNRAGTTKARWYERTGQYDLAIKEYEKAISWQPNRLLTQLNLATLYRNIGNYDKAYSKIKDVVNKLQSDSYYFRSLSNLQYFMGNKENAMQLLDTILDKHKGNFSLRRSLNFLNNKRMLDKYVTNGDKVILDYEKTNWKPNSSSIVVLDECIYKILEDGSRITRVHTINQPNTKDDLVKMGEINIRDGAEYYALRAIKPDGRILLPEYIEGKNSASIPDLEVGDYIEQDYVIAYNKDRRLTDGRMYYDRFYFVNNLPTFDSNVVILKPENREMNILELNYTLNKAAKVIENGFVVTKYLNDKIEPFVPEPMMPVTEETRPMIHMDEPVKWEEIRDLFRQKLSQFKKITPEMVVFAHEVTKGLKTDYQKAKAIYYAVTQTIDGENKDFDFSNYASNILALKEGNRLLLISQLLRILDIKNEYILVKPKNIKEINYHGGTLQLYNDPLLRVRLDDGQSLYLEANFKESVFNEPSPMNLGTKALVLNGEELFTTLPTKTSTYENKELSLVVNIQQDGSAVCEGLEQIHGYYSIQLRKYLKKIPDDKVNQFFEVVLNKSYPGITILESQMKNLHDASKPIILFYRFKIDRYARQVENKLRLPTTLFKVGLSQNYIKVHDREHPLLVNSVTNGYNIAKINFPADYRLLRSPDNQTIENEFGVYRFNVDTSGNSVKFTRAYTIPIQKIGLDKYMDFYKFCSQVDQLEREDLTLIHK